MRIIPIIKRLKDEVPLLGGERVEQATSLIALSDDEIDNDIPICFIHTLREKAGPNETIGGVDQVLPKQFNVMYAAQNIELDVGDEPLEDLRKEVFSSLLGWQPDTDHSPVEFVEGGILATSDRFVWWVDTFVTEAMLCN